MDHQKKLTNNQMLQFPFLRFSPLKPLLFRGFLLKEDKEFPEFAGDAKTAAAAAGSEEDKKATGEDEKAGKAENESEEIDPTSKNITKLVEEQRKRDLKMVQCKAHYIGFKEFARYISVFNRKTPLDLKIKCTFFQGPPL